MAKKRNEPFNPWPGFVDLFASVITVVLMFMLVLIVNITYYAQFKYKVSYTGTVAIQETVTKPIDVLDKSNKVEKKEFLIEDQTLKVVKDDSKKELKSIAGMDLSMVDNNFTRQDNIVHEDWMAVKYLDSEVILDPQSIKDVEKFLVSAKEKFFEHYVSVYIKEPENQISASVGKQLALSRVLNIRNLIRKKGYKEDDIIIRLKDKIPEQKSVKHASGYAIITINRKK